MDPLAVPLDPVAEKRLKRGIVGTGMVLGGALSAAGMVGFASGNTKAGYTLAIAGLVFTTVLGFVRLYEE